MEVLKKKVFMLKIHRERFMNACGTMLLIDGLRVRQVVIDSNIRILTKLR